ncbi:hypothetical protein [Chimaeribacter arupi]|uniref:hypothetical protein n=1 Tax=Chimaeribacter arupi TaxID=2060066 RepID=UPI001F4D4EB9|nr:hypothetical protein [Chimaeribacter arupi]
MNLNFSRIDFEYPKDNYERFKKSISSLLVELKITTSKIAKEGMRIKLIGSHVNIGFSGDYQVQIDSIKEIIKSISVELNCQDKRVSSFARHKAQLLIERLHYVSFDFDNLDLFSEQLIDILELKNEISKHLGSNEDKEIKEEDKKELKRRFLKGLNFDEGGN